MLGIKLVDVDTSNACVEKTGTCELCFGSMWCDNPILIFENPNTKPFALNNQTKCYKKSFHVFFYINCIGKHDLVCTGNVIYLGKLAL